MGNIIHTYRGEKKKHLIMDEIGRIDHYITKHADEEMFVFFKWKSQKNSTGATMGNAENISPSIKFQFNSSNKINNA